MTTRIQRALSPFKEFLAAADLLRDFWTIHKWRTVLQMMVATHMFFRFMLRNTKINYPAFMDLQYSRIGDDKFAGNLNKCGIITILLPKKGTPCSMNNYYTDHPLFSEKIRESFKAIYIHSEGR